MIEHPFWWDTVAPESTARAAADSLPPAVDVAVIGAGYTGLAAARVLASGGATVVVLERDQIGAGASSRNGGQVLTGLKVEPAALVARHGQTRARALFDCSTTAIRRLEENIRLDAIDCEFVRSGHVQAACKPSHFEAFRSEQALLARVFDHRVELVPASEQRSELGSDRYHGLMLDESSAGLNPAKYVHGLARAAERAGARLFCDTEVQRLARRANGWTLTSSRGAVDATDLLIATNGYVSAVTPSLQRRYVPVGSYVIATEPLDAATAGRILPRRRMAFDSKHFLYYFRLTADRRLLFGGRAEFTTPTAASARRAAETLRRGMVELFPELAGTRVDYAWGGTVAFTRDQLPHAGRLDGFFFAGGYCGHGIAMATWLGDLIGRRIAGQSVDAPLFDDRFPAIPLHYGKPWFLPLAGAYYRFLDWIT